MCHEGREDGVFGVIFIVLIVRFLNVPERARIGIYNKIKASEGAQASRNRPMRYYAM